MAINKVVYGNSTLIDLTEDTVSANNLLAGETAHDRSGASVVGEVVIPEVVDNLTTQDSTKALSAKQGYVLNQNKVDKVTGKGLSTNDYTNEEKTKLAGISAGAEPNVQSDWKQSDSSSDDFIKNKPTSDIKTSDDGQFTTVTGGLMQSCVVDLEPIQDLHGYSKPWVGGSGKNKIPLTVSGIKSANSGATWSGNSCTINGVTWTINTDSDGNVIGIKANGTAIARADFNLVTSGTYINAGNYILNGCPTNGSSSTYRLQIWNFTRNTGYNDFGSNANVNNIGTGDILGYQITIFSGYVASNLIFYPMLRLSSVSDATFEPYTNICPISGHAQVQVGNVGKNQYNKDAKNTSNGFVQNKYLTNTGSIENSANDNISEYIKVVPNTSYVLSGIYGNSASYCLYDGNKTFISGTAYSGQTTVTFNSQSAEYVRFTVHHGNENIVQLELGTTATTFEPYNGYTTTINLGGTYYGGTLDAVSGEFTVTHKYTDITAFAMRNGSTANKMFITNPISDARRPSTNMENVYPISNRFDNSNDYNHLYGYTEVGIALNSSGNVGVAFGSTSEIDTLEKANTWLSSNPLQVVYELATPQTIQLTPKQLETLVGQNDVFAPLQGQTVEEVEYREVLAIDDVPKAISYENVAPDMGTGENRTYFRIKKYGRLVQLEFIQSNYWMVVEQQTKVVFGVLPDGYYDKQPSSMLYPDVEFEYPFVNETATNQYDNRKLFINMVNGEVYSVYQANDVIHPMGNITYILHNN